MQLSCMLDAGLSIEKSLISINQPPNRDQTVLSKITQGVRRGESLAATLEANKVINQFDAYLLQSAESVGRLPQGLEHISKLKASRENTFKKLSSLALFPQAILVIGAFAGIFVRTAQQGQPIIDAFLDVMTVLFLSLIIIRIVILLLTIDARIPLSIGWHFLFLHKRSIWFQQHFELLFYRSLTWQIASGEDFAKALNRNVLLLKSKSYQHATKLASQQAQCGIDVLTILSQNKLVLSNRMRQILSIGIDSGTTESAVQHELKLINHAIKQRTQNLVSWWPRALYVAALVVILKYMFL